MKKYTLKDWQQSGQNFDAFAKGKFPFECDEALLHDFADWVPGDYSDKAGYYQIGEPDSENEYGKDTHLTFYECPESGRYYCLGIMPDLRPCPDPKDQYNAYDNDYRF